MRSISFETWVEKIADERVYCDELALMGLCYMYHRHCVVLTQNKLWSTVQADTPLNLLDLLKECIGNLCFGVLTWGPRLPKKVATKSPGFNIIKEYTLDKPNAPAGSKQDAITPVVKPVTVGNVGTSAMGHTNVPETGNHVASTSSTVHVETSVLDLVEVPETGNSAKSIISTGKVSTSATEHKSLMETENPAKGTLHAEYVETRNMNCIEAKECDSDNLQDGSVLSENKPNTTVHVVTKTEDTASSLTGFDNNTEQLPSPIDTCSQEQDLHVETSVTCPEYGIFLSQYPWKQWLDVKIDRIHPVEIDIWYNKVSDYYVYTTPKCVTPIISDIKGYGLRKRPIKEENSFR